MTPSWFALAERVHGHLAVLGVALLIHPCVLLPHARNAARARRLAEIGATLLVAAFCSGWAIYGTYRDEMKPGLLAAYPALARLFETKEHLAAIATAFAASGALALRLAPSSQAVREAARVALMAAVGTALVAGIAGILVAPAGGPALWRR